MQPAPSPPPIYEGGHVPSGGVGYNPSPKLPLQEILNQELQTCSDDNTGIKYIVFCLFCLERVRFPKDSYFYRTQVQLLRCLVSQALTKLVMLLNFEVELAQLR